LSIFLSLVWSANAPFKDSKCRGLALRGGGTKGAFEVGAMKALIELMNSTEIQYDIVEGVSIGAWNAGYLASFAKGDERQAVEILERGWLDNPVGSLYKQWPIIGPFQCFWKTSVLDNSPMSDYLEDYFNNNPLKRAL
jgi:NTE family protein